MLAEQLLDGEAKQDRNDRAAHLVAMARGMHGHLLQNQCDELRP